MDSIADHIISKVGAGSKARGIKRIAFYLQRSPGRIYFWTYDREKGGTDGLVPARDQKPLILAARADGIDLTPADFFGPDFELPPLGTPANENTLPGPSAAGNSHPSSEKE